MNIINTFTLVVPVWLDLNDLSHLDIAITNRMLRPMFLSIMKSKECVYGVSNNQFTIKGASFIQWLLSRNIVLYIKSLKLAQPKVADTLKCLDNIHFKCFDNFIGIESLAICHAGGTVDMETIVSSLEKLKDLKHIELNGNFMRNISSCNRIQLAKLLGEYCGAKLLSLTLYEGGGFTDIEIDYILKNCPNIELLKLSYVDGDGGSTLIKSVVNNCIRVQKLDLGWHRYVTDQDVINLLRVCTKLKSLSLKCAFDITDIVIHEITSNALLTQSIQELNIMKCHRITDAALIHLVENCINLRILHVTLDGAINEESIEHCMVFFPRVNFILSESNVIHSLH